MFKKIIIFIALLFLIIGSYIVYSKIQKIPKIEEKIEQKFIETTEKIEEIKETIAPKPTKILESGIPNKHLINTTFVPQAPEKKWDQPWQDACEEAALLTVHYFYQQLSPNDPQIKSDILKMIDFENTQSFSHDMNIEQMGLVAQKYLGYSPKIINNPSLDDIKKYIAQNVPVIVPASGKLLYKENKHFKSQGPYYHNLTILGYNDDQQKFTVHDVGTQFGAYFKYSYSLLMDSIHDFPDSKNKLDINNGDKKVLILLK
jgi:hypothetical protein